MTTRDLLEMIDRARFVKVGLCSPAGDWVYLEVTRDQVRSKASQIAGFDLDVEFGTDDYDRDTLYIESVRGRR